MLPFECECKIKTEEVEKRCFPLKILRDVFVNSGNKPFFSQNLFYSELFFINFYLCLT